MLQLTVSAAIEFQPHANVVLVRYRNYPPVSSRYRYRQSVFNNTLSIRIPWKHLQLYKINKMQTSCELPLTVLVQKARLCSKILLVCYLFLSAVQTCLNSELLPFNSISAVDNSVFFHIIIIHTCESLCCNPTYNVGLI